MANYCTEDDFILEEQNDSFGFAQTIDGPLPINMGGTGATTAEEAREKLGLGTAAEADIDPTLTIAGDAADAKAAGDADRALTAELDQQKALLAETGLFGSAVSSPAETTTSRRLDPSTGLCVTNSSYVLYKFPVSVGEELTIVSDDSFQFQNSSAVPSSGTSNRIGETYGTGSFTLNAPEGATYLIVSTKSTASQATVARTIGSAPDNGSLYTDIMANGGSDVVTSRQFMVLKNHVSVTRTTGSSSSYKYCNLFGTPVIGSTSWTNADLSSDYFCPLGFDTSKANLLMRIQWDRTYDTTRNTINLATKNENTGTVTKIEVSADSGAQAAVINLSTITPELVENGNFALYMLSRNTGYTNGFKYWLYLESKAAAATDIVSLNSDAFNRVGAANWWWGEHTAKPALLNLLHFSDIHGWKESLVRVVEMKNFLKAKSLLTDAVCTGDIQRSSYAGGQFDSVWSATPGTEDILFTIGNHDTYEANNTGKITEAQKYAAYFSGRTAALGITMPADTSYWYKDYPDQGIRLIGVDPSVVDTDSDQKSWLETTLAGAKALGYAVIVASHYLRLNSNTAITSATILDNNWSNSRARAMTTDVMTYDWYGTDIVKCVSDFVDDGGQFVCYLIGHTHTDILSHPTGRPEQLIINICAAAIEEATGANRIKTSNDLPRMADTLTRDAFNLVTVDTSTGLLTCVRFGASLNFLQKPRTAFVYDYVNHSFVTVS